MSRKFYYLSITYIFQILLSITNAYAFEADKGHIKGVVTTTDGKPAAHVSVDLVGTSRKTVTSADGDFTLRDIAAGNYEIRISLVGYQRQTQQVTVIAGKTSNIDIRLNISDQQLQEVIVSSTRNKFKTSSSKDVAKLPLANLENPQVYTTINKELLQEQGVFTADDAIRNAPGITKLWAANGRAGDGSATYTMRGFTTAAKLRNGMAGQVTSTVDAINLEKMEVIKGPSGTLYGSTLVSYGGLINRVTKQPYDHFGGEISYSAGSYGLSRVTADINTPLDKEHKALLRINTAYNSMGSFQDNGFSKNFAFDPSFSYKVNDRLTLSFEAEINYRKATMPAQYFFYTTYAQLGVDRADQLNVDYKKSYQAGDLVQTSNNTNFYGTAIYKMSDQWKSQTTFSTTQGSSDGASPYFFLMPGDTTIKRMIWTLDGNTNNIQLQQNFTGDFHIGSLRNRMVVGLDYLNQVSNIRYINPMPAGGPALFDTIPTRGKNPAYYNFNKDNVNNLYQTQPKAYTYNYTRYNIYSVYVSDVLNLMPNLMVMASIRMDHFNSQPVNNPVDDKPTQGFDQTTFSPKLGIVYQVVKDKVSLFGNYMNGFTNPGYKAVANETGGLTNKLFKSEQANQWEAGVKLDVWDGRLSSTISYYDIQVKNKAIQGNIPGSAIQAGTQYSKGFEAEVNANPFTGFNIVAGYAYNDSKWKNAAALYAGRRPTSTGPLNAANLWLSYTLATTAAKGLGIGFGGNYAGDNMVINNAINGVFTLPAYTVLNAAVYYNQPKYRIAINVNNLANREYWTGFTTADPQMLRQVTGTLAYKF
ncbi:TonB-dependent receptor domain-containing protein [Chitinophaga sp. RAB17]|uniref:TonB-dependent receptor domain-containing protein n=1 Tax=Chitinophaga sp. RAB17 TaxID=3233049 RepID=UPI003F8FA1D9